jgi:hypothetical protein
VTPQITRVCPIETSTEPLACGATFSSKSIDRISSGPRPSFRCIAGNLDVAGICATKDFATFDGFRCDGFSFYGQQSLLSTE